MLKRYVPPTKYGITSTKYSFSERNLSWKNHPQIEHYIWILNSKKTSFSLLKDCIDGVMVSTLSGIDLGFKPRSCQSKDYKIGICRFFTWNKHH
jgi:hypothetical protein